MTDQRSLDENEKVQSSVRMTTRERENILDMFGGIQKAFDRVLREAEEYEDWTPDVPKRLIPAYRGIQLAARDKDNQIVNSNVLRKRVMRHANCTRKTAVRYLHQLRDEGLLFTLGNIEDEFVHFVAVCKEDWEAIKSGEVRRHEVS